MTLYSQFTHESLCGPVQCADDFMVYCSVACAEAANASEEDLFEVCVPLGTRCDNPTCGQVIRGGSNVLS